MKYYEIKYYRKSSNVEDIADPLICQQDYNLTGGSGYIDKYKLMQYITKLENMEVVSMKHEDIIHFYFRGVYVLQITHDNRTNHEEVITKDLSLVQGPKFQQGDRFYEIVHTSTGNHKKYGTVKHVRTMYGNSQYVYMVSFDDPNYTEHNAHENNMVAVVKEDLSLIEGPKIHKNDREVYVPRFISDIFEEGPMFGIEYANGVYHVGLIDRRQIQLKNNYNHVKAAAAPAPPIPPNNPPDGSDFIPSNLPGPGGPGPINSPSPSNNNYINPPGPINSPSNNNYINSTRPLIIYTFFEVINKILIWTNRGESINISQDVFNNMKFKNYVYYDVINSYQNIFTSDIFASGPLFSIQDRYYNNIKFYIITLLEPIHKIVLNHNFDVINFLPFSNPSIEKLYSLYPHLSNYISKSKLANYKLKYVDIDDSSSSSSEEKISKEKINKIKISKKKSSKKKSIKKKSSKKKSSKKKSSKKKSIKKK